MFVPCCSDILTPLPALGVPFEIDDVKGPIIAEPVRSLEQVIYAMDTSALVQRNQSRICNTERAAGEAIASSRFEAATVCGRCFDIPETRSHWSGESCECLHVRHS